MDPGLRAPLRDVARVEVDAATPLVGLALLDWDEARLDAVVTELARSVWEFGKNADGDALDEARAAAFLAAYEGAGGPAYPRNLIVPLIRANLRAELERGGPHDPAYDAAERRAFATLSTLAGPLS